MNNWNTKERVRKFFEMSSTQPEPMDLPTEDRRHQLTVKIEQTKKDLTPLPVDSAHTFSLTGIINNSLIRLVS